MDIVESPPTDATNAHLPDEYSKQIIADITTGRMITTDGYVMLLLSPTPLTTGMFHDYWMFFRRTNQTAIDKYGMPTDIPKMINMVVYNSWKLEEIFLKFINLDTDIRKNKLLGLDFLFETGQRFTVRRCTELDHKFVSLETIFTTLQVTPPEETDASRYITEIKKEQFGDKLPDTTSILICVHVAKDDPINPPEDSIENKD